MNDRHVKSGRGALTESAPARRSQIGLDERVFGRPDAPWPRPGATEDVLADEIVGEFALLNLRSCFAHRCALAVGALDTLGAAAPAEWLRNAGALVGLVAEERVVELWSCRFIAPSRRWRTEHAVATRGFNERVERALAEVIVRDCPLQDVGFQMPPEPAWLKTRREMITDDHWRDGERRKVRVALGVDEFVQAGFRYTSGATEHALVVQLSSPAGHPAPARDGESLAAVAPFIFRSFHRRFVALESLRAELLAALKPGERSLPELLVQGMSEREAGERLGRSRHTVHEKVRSIYKAWGVVSRFELVEVWNGLRTAHVVPHGSTALAPDED